MINREVGDKQLELASRQDGMKTRRGFSGCIVWLVLGAFLAVAAAQIQAHDDPNANVPAVRALKTDLPIHVDGVLDEPFWQDAEITSNFIDIRTQQSAEPQTLAHIAYTRTHLYVAVECLDDHIDQIHASERHEDREFKGDDWVEVHFDPTHSHRGKYAFFSNPLGTRADANEGPSGVFNRGWTADWELAAKILPDRWVFEMSIPFSIMNYIRSDNQTWGLNFTRRQVSTDITSFWSYNATNFYKPRYFGHLTGLDLADADFDRNLEITPYVSSAVDFNHNTSSIFQAGVDTSFRLTPSITTSWTLNPDFGQVEADDDTIELRDTERFLTEKRLFFREGEELMNMHEALNYSRRFTDIEAGARVTGTMRDYRFTFLDLQGNVSHNGARYGNTSVFRLLQNVGEKSTVGYYLTDSEFDDGHSRVAGLDGEIFLTDDLRWRMQTALADDRWEDEFGATLKDRLDYLGYTSLAYDKYPWYVSLGYVGITEGFDPALGYIPRRDIFGPRFRVGYHHEAEDRWYKSLDLYTTIDVYENEEGQTILRDYSFDGEVVFPNDFGLELEYDHDYHAPYDNRRTQAGFSLFNSDFWRSMNVAWAGGQFENIDYNELILGKRLQPLERLPIRYEFVIRFEEDPLGDEDTVWLNRVVFDYYFTDTMWLKTSLQHQGDGAHNISVIYGWEFMHNAHWYLVFNGVDNEDESGNRIFTKLTYTF